MMRDVVETWWPRILEAARFCEITLSPEAQRQPAASKKDLWRPLRRAARQGHLPLRRWRKEIRDAKEPSRARDLELLLGVVEFGAAQLGFIGDLADLRDAELRRACEAALQHPFLAARETNLSDETLDSYLRFLAEAYTRIARRPPRRGVKYGISSETQRPSSPGVRFLTAGTSFVPNYAPSQASDWLRQLPPSLVKQWLEKPRV